jgi:hypothetical protein
VASKKDTQQRVSDLNKRSKPPKRQSTDFSEVSSQQKKPSNK